MPFTMANDDPCLLCDIIAGKVPSVAQIRQTALTFSAVPPRQRETGQVVIYTLRHVPTLLDLTDEEVTALAIECRATAHALMRVYDDVKGFLLYENNGVASLQEAPHVHVHVVPRREGSDWRSLRWTWDAQPDQTPAKLLDALQ